MSPLISSVSGQGSPRAFGRRRFRSLGPSVPMGLFRFSAGTSVQPIMDVDGAIYGATNGGIADRTKLHIYKINVDGTRGWTIRCDARLTVNQSPWTDSYPGALEIAPNGNLWAWVYLEYYRVCRLEIDRTSGSILEKTEWTDNTTYYGLTWGVRGFRSPDNYYYVIASNMGGDNNGERGGSLRKLSSSAQGASTLWTRRCYNTLYYNGVSNDRGNGPIYYSSSGFSKVVFDSSNNPYVWGYHSPGVNSSGGAQRGGGSILVKYDTNGTVQWQRYLCHHNTALLANGTFSGWDNSSSSRYYHSINDMTIDTTDNGLYFIGTRCDGTMSGYEGFRDAFIFKLNSSGNLSWHRNLTYNRPGGNVWTNSPGSYEYGKSVTAGKDTYIYAAITGNSRAVILKFDSSGNLIDERRINPSSGSTSISYVNVTTAGFIEVTGSSSTSDNGVSGNFFISIPMDGFGTYGTLTYALATTGLIESQSNSELNPNVLTNNSNDECSVGNRYTFGHETVTPSEHVSPRNYSYNFTSDGGTISFNTTKVSV